MAVYDSILFLAIKAANKKASSIPKFIPLPKYGPCTWQASPAKKIGPF